MKNTYSHWLATALLLLTTSLVSAQCDTVAAEVRVNDPQVTYEVGEESLNLDIFPVAETEQRFPIIDQLSNSATPRSAFTYRIRSDGSCRSIGDTTSPVNIYPIVSPKTATYQFIRLLPRDQGQSVSLHLFEGTFDPAVDNCDRLLASSFQNPGINQPDFTVDLVAGKAYSLVVLPGSSPSVTYPRDYRIQVFDLAENAFTESFPRPVALAPNYGYTYIAVDQEDNVIDTLADDGDFRQLGAGTYLVYGINYDSATVAPLSFISEDFNDFRFDSDGNRRCFSISSNQFLLLIADSAAPVDWLTFTATATDKTVKLFWDVAAETENDYFRVERSADGSSWTDLGEVAGNGTTQVYAAFDFTDSEPLAGTAYYRLAQVDFDGTEHLSTVVEATLAGGKFTALTTYPNPFVDRLTVAAGRVPQGEPRLYDLQGRDVSLSLSVQITDTGAVIHTGNLPTGMYLLRWGSEEVRVIKQ